MTSSKSKTISVGGEVGSGGLRFGVSVKWVVVHCKPVRKVYVKVGCLAVLEADWSDEGREAALGVVQSMLGESEPDLCSYLCRALGEVEL